MKIVDNYNICLNYEMKIIIAFDNYPGHKLLKTGWGYSAVIPELKLMFDTGSDGNILIQNLGILKINPKELKYLFISHSHYDHTGGINAILKKNPEIRIFQKIKSFSEILENVYTSGEMGRWVKEQSLCIRTEKGLVILTGCAHPGIENIAKLFKEKLNEKIYLLMGGFHLLHTSRKEIYKVINKLKELGVEKIAPSHCTGDTAMKLFEKEWEDNFIKAYVGAEINI